MIFKSISDLSNDIFEKLLPNLPRDIGVVYGIPRSGMLPATILATSLGVDLGILGGQPSFGERKKNIVIPKGSKILLVDDSIHTGKAMLKASMLLKHDRSHYYTCAVYAHSKSIHLIDFYADVIDNGRIFQWNFTGIKATKNYCWDMDGVICTNPSVLDDDGEIYRNEILNCVKPLYIPQVIIKAIITNRIERWRTETEAWLNRYGIQYEQLIMQPYATALERRKNSTPEAFKAKNFLEQNGTIYIESHDNQAKNIAKLSGRPVLSIASMKLFN